MFHRSLSLFQVFVEIDADKSNVITTEELEVHASSGGAIKLMVLRVETSDA